MVKKQLQTVGQWLYHYDFLNDGDVTKHACGGTILSNSYILTAANCFDGIRDLENPPYMTVAAGIYRRSQSQQIIRAIDRIIIHPNWTISGARSHHDIALLHLAEPLDFKLSSSITRTCLSSQLNTTKELIQYPAHDTTLFVVGWGRLTPDGYDSDILRQIAVYSIDHNDTVCTDLINDTESQFCAGIHNTNTGQ
jgi:trypsin